MDWRRTHSGGCGTRWNELMKPKIRIYPAKEKDMKQVESQFRNLYSDSKKARFYHSKLKLGGFKAGEEVILAKSEGQIAGFLWLVWYEHIRHKGIAYIEELHVAKRFRRMGIGRLLVGRALKEAKKNRSLVVFVCTGNHMKAAQKFYLGVGMKPLKASWFVKDLAGQVRYL